jgi:chromosome segregation ATPase
MPPKSKRLTAYQKRKQERDQCKARLTTVENSVQDQAEELRQAQERLEACRTEVDHHDQHILTLQQQHDEKQAELRESQQRIRDHEAEQARLQQLEEELLGKIAVHITNASERSAAMTELQQLHDTIQTRLEEQTNNVEEERRQHMELRQEQEVLREQYENLLKTHADAMAQHRAVQDQLDQTRSELVRCMADKKDIEDAFVERSKSMRRLEIELSFARKDRDEKLFRYNNCEHRVGELFARLDEKDTELGALQTEKQRLLEDIRRLQEERDALEGERYGLVTESQAQAQTLMMTTTQKDQLESQLEQCTSEKASMSLTLQTEQRALDNQRHQVMTCSMQRDEDQHRFQRELQHKEAELTERLANLNAEHERAVAQLHANLSERDEHIIELQYNEHSCKTGRDLDRQQHERAMGEQKFEMSTMAMDAEAKLIAKQNELSMASRDLNMCSSQKEEERTTHSRALQFRDMEHQRVVAEKQDDIRALQDQLHAVQERDRGLVDQLAQCEERFSQHQQLSTDQLAELRDEIQDIQTQQEACRSETARLTTELESSKRSERESQTQYYELKHQNRVLSNEHNQSVLQAEQRYQSALQDKIQSVSQAQEEKRTALAMARSNFDMDTQTLQSQFDAQRNQLEQELASVRSQMTMQGQLLDTKEEALRTTTAQNYRLEQDQVQLNARLVEVQRQLTGLFTEKSAMESQHDREVSALQNQLVQEQASTDEQRRQVTQLQQQHVDNVQQLERQIAASQNLQDQLTRYQELNQTLEGDQRRLVQQLAEKTAAFEAQVMRIEQGDRSLAEKAHEIEDAKYDFDQQLEAAKERIEQNHQYVVAELEDRFTRAQQQHADGKRALEEQLDSIQMQFDAQKSDIDRCQAKIRQVESANKEVSDVNRVLLEQVDTLLKVKQDVIKLAQEVDEE